MTRMGFLNAIVLGALLTLTERGEETPRPPFYSDRTNLLTVADNGGTLRPVKTRADWELRRSHILANLEQVMGPLPVAWRRLPLEMRVLETNETPKWLRQKITFRTEPEDCVTAYLFRPHGFAGKRPAVLCLHQTIEVGKEEPAGLGGSPDLHYAQELAERGYITLAPDFWTFGDYRRSAYDPYQHGYVSGTMKGIWNHMRSLDLLQSLPEVDAERLGCIGHSLGGHNTLWLGAFDERVKVMVSSCGFNSMAAYAASPYGGGNLKNYAQRRYMPRLSTVYGNDPAKVPWDWPEVLAALAPRAVFINAPLRDENFVVAGVRPCVSAAAEVYAWMKASSNLVLVAPDAGHSFPAATRQAAFDFIDRALRQ